MWIDQDREVIGSDWKNKTKTQTNKSRQKTINKQATKKQQQNHPKNPHHTHKTPHIQQQQRKYNKQTKQNKKQDKEVIGSNWTKQNKTKKIKQKQTNKQTQMNKQN